MIKSSSDLKIARTPFSLAFGLQYWSVGSMPFFTYSLYVIPFCAIYLEILDLEFALSMDERLIAKTRW